MKKLVLLAGLVATTTLTGCATPSSPVFGLITNAKWDGGVSNSEVAATKTGQACASSILGIIASGDASIEAAKAAGGITKVATVDHNTESYVVYGEYCTIVTGE